MIFCRYNPDGSLTIFLQRCNDWGDHRRLGRDGDIVCGTIPAEAFTDVNDALLLVSKIKQRLREPEETEAQ